MSVLDITPSWVTVNYPANISPFAVPIMIWFPENSGAAFSVKAGPDVTVSAPTMTADSASYTISPPIDLAGRFLVTFTVTFNDGSSQSTVAELVAK